MLPPLPQALFRLRKQGGAVPIDATLTRRLARRLTLSLALGLGLSLGPGAWVPAQALEVGHARMLSGAGQPLRLSIPLNDVSPDEAATLTVRLADAPAWQQSGLTPPVALGALRVTMQPGADAHRRDLLVTADQAPHDEVVDMLLALESASGQRRIQVSFVVPAQAAPGGTRIQPPRVEAAHTGVSTVTVRRGDTLSGIAQARRYNDVSLYQMLAALYQANPQAFIQRNMNLVKAGARLTVPDAQAVRAIDPAEARRIFLAHSAAFARYRAGIASVADVVAAEAPESGQLEPPAQVPEPAAVGGDRVRLSSDIPSAQAAPVGDAQIVQARAEQDLATRVAQLERNVADMSQMLAAARDGQAAADSTATQTTTFATPLEDATNALPRQHAADALPAQASRPSLPSIAQANAATPDPSGDVAVSWWQGNLPLWITGGLAGLAVIVAWVMRRANVRGYPYDDDDPSAEPSEAVRAQFARRLADIDLDLDPSPDSPDPSRVPEASAPAPRG